MLIENLIIGSGPTGITVANELLKKGKKVFLIDVGNDIENENGDLKNKYRDDKNLYTFLKKIKQKIKITQQYDNPNIKFPFGSDYVFRINKFEKIKKKNTDFINSNAKGGLSNIWATLVSPFYKKDMESWEINYEDFYQYKKNVEEIMPISSSHDNLDKFFNINIGEKHNFNISHRSKIILDLLEKENNRYNQHGIYFGRAKYAISNKYSYQNVNCQNCGLCHYGCPYDCMYSSKYTLDILLKNKNFTYLKNFFAFKIQQDKNKDSGKIICINTDTNQKTSLDFNNLFISAGPIASALLILRSNLIKNKEIQLKESHRFYLPIILKNNLSFKYTKEKNTLPEIFLEIFNKKISNKSIHLQLYSFSEVMLRPLEKYLGSFVYKIPKIFPFLFNNIYIILGYFHSDDSNLITIKYENTNNDISHYTIDEKIINDTDIKINKLLNLLKKELDFFYINSKFLNQGKTGSSYHYGGSFPMSNQIKKENTTNLSGKLNEYQNIYITDQSVLPDMPGTPTTFNAMINAARIVNEKYK